MKKLLLVLSFALLSTNPPRVSAQTQSQGAPPSSMRSAYAEKLLIPGVPNSGKINDHLYRGAQPRDPGLVELKKSASPPSSISGKKIPRKLHGSKKPRNHWGFASCTSPWTDGLLRPMNRSFSF